IGEQWLRLSEIATGAFTQLGGSLSEREAEDLAAAALAESKTGLLSLGITSRRHITFGGQVMELQPIQTDIIRVLSERTYVSLDCRDIGVGINELVGVNFTPSAIGHYVTAMIGSLRSAAGQDVIIEKTRAKSNQTWGFYYLAPNIRVQVADGVNELIQTQKQRYEALYSPD